MKKLSLVLFILCGTIITKGQDPIPDSIEVQLKVHLQKDTRRADLLNEFAYLIKYHNPVLASNIANEALELSRELGFREGEAFALGAIGVTEAHSGDYIRGQTYLEESLQYFKTNKHKRGMAISLNDLSYIYHTQGNYTKALAYSLEAFKLAQDYGVKRLIGIIQNNIGYIYSLVGDYDQALTYTLSSLKGLEKGGTKADIAYTLNGIAEAYRMQGNFTEAIKYYERSMALCREVNFGYGVGVIESNLADVFEKQGKYQKGLNYAFNALHRIQRYKVASSDIWTMSIIARTYLHNNQLDSALIWGQRCLREAKKGRIKEFIRDASKVMSEANAQKTNYAEAYSYHLLYTDYKDSLLGENTVRRLAIMQYTSDLENKQVQIALLHKEKQLQGEKARRQRQLLYALVGGLTCIILLAGVLWNRNRLKQRANALLSQQKETIEATLIELKATQAYIIQREKMASLGELTTGIAHEIQNPLNFVNNFSEVNLELIAEMKYKLKEGNNEEAIAISQDLENNLEKIDHHGKRADAIVKGMLEHSRASAGKKELTDINALAGDYLKLSYHGIKAKDNNFIAEITTDFDNSISKIEVVPQDIGRVLLNLYNNAFFAVSEKKKRLVGAFKPMISVTTGSAGNKLEISIKDNGGGIPQEIVEKIFQPFFTTKPTGQGTGLGLSLSYDIIKAHGGELNVDTKEGEYSKFIIRLPQPESTKSI